MTKKSLLAKYGALAKQGASAIEVKNAITETEKELKLEEVDEIVFEIFDDPTNDPEPEPIPAAAPQPAAVTTIVNGKKNVPKKKYDIWKGQWHARQMVKNFDGKDMVIKWEFIKEGKPVKTGVPMEEDKAELFNSSRRIQLGNTAIEQMIESGSTAPVFHILQNPFAVREINL